MHFVLLMGEMGVIGIAPASVVKQVMVRSGHPLSEWIVAPNRTVQELLLRRYKLESLGVSQFRHVVAYSAIVPTIALIQSRQVQQFMVLVYLLERVTSCEVGWVEQWAKRVLCAIKMAVVMVLMGHGLRR
jgi:hypothetical protein